MTERGFPKIDPATRSIPFTVGPSPFVTGLRLLQPIDSGTAADDVKQALKGARKIIVGSVRMGYGHHRIAYSALTWALELGAEPFLLDILAPDCVEADIVRNMDKSYSSMSRLAARCGGLVDAAWGKMMLQGGPNMLRFFVALAEKIRGVMDSFPRDVPLISTHPIIGDMAIAAGFKKVINLVFDNHPQYFVLVPGALNLVQSPSYYDKLLDMQCPSENLRVAGHWVSSDIVKNTVKDCQARIARCKKSVLPRRFLIAVGGSGAQQNYLLDLLQGMSPSVKAGSIRLYINCGDHQHIAKAVLAKIKELGWDLHEVQSDKEVHELCSKEPLDAVSEPIGCAPVTVCRFDDHFAAFRCTDLLIRIADVLVTKPSELAFFPVPKLHIRRVGAHEAYSAVRSTEIGDGTVECRSVQHAIQKFTQLVEDQSPLFIQMNNSIITASHGNIYAGSRVACEIACGEMPSLAPPLQSAQLPTPSSSSQSPPLFRGEP